MSRSVTFAGYLGPGDVALSDDGMVTVDRKPHDYLNEFLSTVVRTATTDAVAEAARAAQAWPTYPAAKRGPRPGRTVQVGWSAELAGKGIDDACRTITLPGLDDFEPGRDLESWLLPLTDFTFHFLITPADPA